MMGQITKIEWADRVWNPVTGCTKVSEGCRYCYAEGMALRYWGKRKFSDVQIHCERLHQPSHWKKPQRIFVNSMSDLFHLDVNNDFINQVWLEMEENPHHTFMILTKRAWRMANIMPEIVQDYMTDDPMIRENIWLGVSVEDQESADRRIPWLLKTPSTIRFVSYEPALGQVNLMQYLKTGLIHWVICGGESGNNARPLNPDWVRSARDQCQESGVLFFFKQWGGTRKKQAGRLLDGRTWDEMPG